MSAPAGLGAWVAYPKVFGGYAALAPQLSTLGVQWLAPRAGLGGWNDATWRHGDATRFAEPVFPWLYVRPSDDPSKIARDCAALVDAGAAGILLDPESEFATGDHGLLAARAAYLVQSIRKACPGVFVGYAPMDYIANHPNFPWLEFSALDACMPQVYAWEHDDHGHLYHLARVEEQWAAWEIKHGVHVPRYPIGCTYRPETRGSAALAPIDQEIITSDVAAFLDAVDDGVAPVSLYSIEAAHPQVLDLLRARKRATDTFPTKPFEWTPQYRASDTLPDLVPPTHGLSR